MTGLSASEPATPAQGVLDLDVEIQRQVNGIEMGVLENGIPYLTQRGLSEISGVPRSVIQSITRDWAETHGQKTFGKDRISHIRSKLLKKGFDEPHLFIKTKKDGSIHYAYPDIVCMIILEYYAFEASKPQKKAIEYFRQLAIYGFQQFVYDALGYIPADKWKHYNDRVSILQNSPPDGYFILFNEVAGLIVDLINAGLTVNENTVPDISVGQAWAQNWNDNSLYKKYGDRVKVAHHYPKYYPQAASNPQAIWAYPDTSLPEFRHWFRHEYLPTKFPKYLLKKAHVLPGGKDEAKAIAQMYEPKQIE